MPEGGRRVGVPTRGWRLQRTGGGSLAGRPPVAFGSLMLYQLPSLAVTASAVFALQVAAAGVEVRNVPAPVPGSTP